LDNIVKSIYIHVDAETVLQLLSERQLPVAAFAVRLPDNTRLAGALYKALAEVRKQRFLFTLPSDPIALERIDELARFFFLTNYIFQGNAPLMVDDFNTPAPFRNALKHWCITQGFDEPALLVTEEFTEKATTAGRFTYVSADKQKGFLTFLFNKVINLESWSYEIIFQANSQREVASLFHALDDFAVQLKKNSPAIYKVLSTISELESELKKAETIVRFQEIEINNQKLYNKLIREELQPHVRAVPQLQEQSPVDINKLKNDYSRLCADVGRLRNEIAWYKRTYEERSLMGTIKEKLIRSLRHR